VEKVASWYRSGAGGWRFARVYETVGETVADAAFDSVRGAENVRLRPAQQVPSPGGLPVISELARERAAQGKRKRGGALEERIVEFAASALACPLGFHAVDIRRPVPQSAFEKGHESELLGIAHEVRADFAALCAAMPLTWGIYSTFGRGPSVAELYRKQSAAMIIGGAYVSKAVPSQEIVDALGPAVRVEDVGSGHELAITTPFGGAMKELPATNMEGLWRLLRKATLTDMPWESLSKMER
jgi:hypothetical protein